MRGLAAARFGVVVRKGKRAIAGTLPAALQDQSCKSSVVAVTPQPWSAVTRCRSASLSGSLAAIELRPNGLFEGALRGRPGDLDGQEFARHLRGALAQLRNRFS